MEKNILWTDSSLIFQLAVALHEKKSVRSQLNWTKLRLALVGYIKLFIICILLSFFFHFNFPCLASLERNFSLVALSEILEISPMPIDWHKEEKKVYSENS